MTQARDIRELSLEELAETERLESELDQFIEKRARQAKDRENVADWGKRNPQAAAALQEYSSSEVSPSEREVFKQRLFQPRPVKPQEIRRNAYDV